jgi:hypothetical protein
MERRLPGAPEKVHGDIARAEYLSDAPALASLSNSKDLWNGLGKLETASDLRQQFVIKIHDGREAGP